MGRNRSFRGIVHQKKYRLAFQQLREPQDEPLGEASTEAIRQGLKRVISNENIHREQYSLLLTIHSNSLTNTRAPSARHVPLDVWLNNHLTNVTMWFAETDFNFPMLDIAATFNQL